MYDNVEQKQHLQEKEAKSHVTYIVETLYRVDLYFVMKNLFIAGMLFIRLQPYGFTSS